MQDPEGSRRPCPVSFLEECQCRVSGCGGIIFVDWRRAVIDHYPLSLGGKIMLIAHGHCLKCNQTRAMIKGEQEARHKGILDRDGTLNKSQEEDQRFTTA
jgi:hypothetical protein